MSPARDHVDHGMMHTTCFAYFFFFKMIKKPGLYSVLEAALPAGVKVGAASGMAPGGMMDGGRHLSRAEQLQEADRLAGAYDSARSWFRAHPEHSDRRKGGTFRDEFGMTPLHILCKLPDPPVDVVVELISASPEVVLWADSSGWLPLHVAVASGASHAVLSLLAKAEPKSLGVQDRRRRTPLHFAFFRDDVRAGSIDTTDDGDLLNLEKDEGDTGAEDGADIVALLCGGADAVDLKDENGMLPLHYAAAYGTSPGVLNVLLTAHPSSIRARETHGRIPLHLAMVNAHRPTAPSAIRFLLAHGEARKGIGIAIADMTDREGHLPLYLLADASARFELNEKDGQTHAIESLKHFMAAGPNPSADFLTSVQKLPTWLKDHAVLTPTLQEILNFKISRRLPTFFLLLDGYVILALIVMFEISSNNVIDDRLGQEGTPVGRIEPFAIAIMSGAGYFFLREVVEVISLINMGNFESWIRNFFNWIDIGMMFLTMFLGASMINYSLVGPELFRKLSTATKGILWIILLRGVKDSFVGFAVFWGGVGYVMARLVTFMVALGAVLVAFAMAFFYVFSTTDYCFRDENGMLLDHWEQAHPHCTFGRSLLKTYTMMMGEVDDGEYETTISQILYVLYASLVITLLANVLIAVVTENYGVIKDKRSAMVFWSNRLNSVTEFDAIKIAGRTIICALGSPPSDGGARSSENRMHESPQWNTLTSFFKDGSHGMESPGSFHYLFRCCGAVVAIIIISVWFVLGLATMGLLWPAQIRQKLLCQTKTELLMADMAEDSQAEMKKLRHDLRHLKKVVLTEKRNDRIEVAKIRKEVEAVQNEVIADLQQVKEIMSTVLNIERSKDSK